MDKEQRLNNFWSSFGLIAYDETSVPELATLPYITYETAVSNFDRPISLSMSLWYRSSSWDKITAKAHEIIDKISDGGILLEYEGGCMWITTQSPQYQRMSDSSDEMIRRIIINIMVEFVD